MTSTNTNGETALSRKTGSDFRVKLLQLWMIPLEGSREWGGVWETIGAHDLNGERESWDLRRVMSLGPNQPLGDTERLPKWLLLNSCKCVKLQTLFDPNTQAEPRGN